MVDEPSAFVGLDDRHRRALAVVAIDVTGEIVPVRSALEALDLDPDLVMTAEAAGILRVTADHLEFIDPAQRARALSGIGAIDRRAAHRELARVLTEPRHRAARAEHLAAAAIGPDREAATALAELGREASDRGQPALAGDLLTRAGGLSADVEERANHLYLAGDGYWNAGQYAAARGAFDAAYIGSGNPVLRADIALQLGQLDMYQRGPRHAADLLVTAAVAVEPHDIDRAAMLLVHAGSTVMLSSDVIGSLAHVRRACVLAEQGDGGSVVPASLMLAFLSIQHGDIAEFEARFPALSEIADELKDSDLPEIDLFLQLVGMVFVYTERWDSGRVFLTAVAHRAGRRSRVTTAALASATLAELCWRSGRWDEAWALATSDLVSDVTLTGARLWLLAFTAHLEAGFGSAEDCRAHAHAALAEGEPMGFGTVVIWACHALGLLELGLGHPVAAAAHLDRVDAMSMAHEVVHPGALWWQADHVEALVRSGRPHEAAHALVRFEAAASSSGGSWAPATTSRCRALMSSEPDDAERWFEDSLLHHDHLAAPFELARTLLCRAERRIATGSRLNPSPDLAEAIAIFDSLGATSWSTQGAALRDAMSTDGPPGLEGLLSPAERRVAEAVAEGLSNREVAGALYISERTVEFHLHNVFRKLKLRSRTQLVRRLTQR